MCFRERERERERKKEREGVSEREGEREREKEWEGERERERERERPRYLNQQYCYHLFLLYACISLNRPQEECKRSSDNLSLALLSFIVR